jgi:hypothetical protein
MLEEQQGEGIRELCADLNSGGALKRETNVKRNYSPVLLKHTLLSILF